MPNEQTAEYTPAPWAINGAGDIVREVDDLGEVLIAEIAKMPTDDEKAANAQLIVAAPELLKACEALVWACDNAPPVELVELIKHISDACEKAKLAINKAKVVMSKKVRRRPYIRKDGTHIKASRATTRSKRGDK